MREPLYEESLYGLLERLRHIRSHAGPRVRPLRKVQPLGGRSLQVESPGELPTIKAIQEIATPSELKFLLCDLNTPEAEFQKFRSHGLSVATQVRKLLACGSLEAADRMVAQSSKYIAAQVFRREKARVTQELEKQRVTREREEVHLRLELERKRAAIEAQLSAALPQSVSEADAINRAINAEGVDGGEQRLDRDMRLGRMLKQCHEILTNRKYGRDTKFAILSRVEQLGRGYPNLAAFHRKVKQTLLPEELERFLDFDAQVRCGTVHSFKGLEADVVVVLGVNERNFPKIHPDNELYSVLGVTATSDNPKSCASSVMGFDQTSS